MTNQSKSILKRHAIQRKNDLAPIELLAREYINAMGYAIMDNSELEKLRQAAIRDFVNTLEPVAWCDEGGHLWWDCQRKHFPQASDKPLYDLSEWSNK